MRYFINVDIGQIIKYNQEIINQRQNAVSIMFGRDEKMTKREKNKAIRHDKNDGAALRQSQKRAVTQKISQMLSMADYDTDPLGSYTGVPENNEEMPTQDADDL